MTRPSDAYPVKKERNRRDYLRRKMRARYPGLVAGAPANQGLIPDISDVSTPSADSEPRKPSKWY